HVFCLSRHLTLRSAYLRSLFFFFYCYAPPRDLHSFPTRRSSDLALGLEAGGGGRRDGARSGRPDRLRARVGAALRALGRARVTRDRKSTRLNSSHRTISYAVFCLKKKKKNIKNKIKNTPIS